jgi:hypothetical protein
MKKVYGKYFAWSTENSQVNFGGHDLSSFLFNGQGEPYHTRVKVFGIRPDIPETFGTAGVEDELTLTKININGKENIVGSVEFRMCAYLHYRFDEQTLLEIKKQNIKGEV